MNIVNIVDDEGNVISCTPNKEVYVNFVGEGNKVILHKDLNIGNLRMTLGNNVTVKIEKSIHKIENMYVGALRSTGGGYI